MNIISTGNYPSNALSNFAAHKFTIDGVICNSMEGFLQSLKFKSKEMQEVVCTYIGSGAKKKGSNKNWKASQTLYWRGVPIKRDSSDYQDLLTKAYNCMFEQSEGLRKALIAAGSDAVFKHSIGKNKINETILTESEFCGQLMRLKNALNNKKQN